jgi:hypothetical protein
MVARITDSCSSDRPPAGAETLQHGFRAKHLIQIIAQKREWNQQDPLQSRLRGLKLDEAGATEAAAENTMGLGIGIGLGALIVAFLVYRVFVPSLDGLADRAAREGNLGPLLAAIEKRPESAQPTAYNHAIRRYWDGFQRPLAVELIRTLAMNFGTTRITQYWLRQVQQVEPKLARELLGREFIKTYYLPEVAAQCGPVG